MRIGIDASRAFSDKRTGTEEYSYQIIKHILQLPGATNHQWTLYVRSDFEFRNSNLKLNSNCKVKIIPMTRLWTQVGLALRTWLDKLDLLWIPAHTLPVLRLPTLNTLVTIHGIEYEWLPAYENPLQKLYLPLSTHYAVMSASRIIAVSGFTKNQLLKRLHANSKKITVVYEGVAHQVSRKTVADSRKILKKYKLQQKKYLLFIGTIQPRKNLIRLMRAFAKIDSIELKLAIVGKLGWLYDEILATPKALNLENRIVILGYLSSAERNILLQNALVYMQPSITEGFGLPVLEAMAAGVPVVSSNGGALAEIVAKSGLTFDPYNIEDMAAKISQVITDGKLRQQLISKGRRRVLDFSWQKAAKQTLHILEEM